MMGHIFQLYSDSMIATSFFVLCALLFHRLFRKRPSSQLYFIWLFVLIRLLFPFSINPDWKFGAYTIPREVLNMVPVDIDLMASDTDVPIGMKENGTNVRKASVKIDYPLIFQFVWVIGILCFITNYLLRMHILRKKTKRSVQLAQYKNVWRWKDNTGACVIGLFRPQIYVPSDCEGNKLDFIIRHESQHIKHFDYLFVTLFYFALALNWYNPLAWLAYQIAMQDVEKACDECVLLRSTVEERQAYARHLLDFSIQKSEQSVTVGFGKSNIKKRIINIVENKQKKKICTVFIVMFSIVLLGLCACFPIGTGYRRAADATEHQKMAYTIGEEKIGAVIPDIIYADNNKCIFYDYHGVFIYEFSKEELSDYIAFQKIGFLSRIQGDNANFVFSRNQGRMVYITNDTKCYLYDCEKKMGELKNCDPSSIPKDSMDSLQVRDESEENAVSAIYMPEKNEKLYWLYEGDAGKYSELCLIFDKNGDIEKYPVFNK